MVAYLMLAVAVVTEVLATVALKNSDGFSKLTPSIVVVVGYATSFTLLGLALSRGLPMGMAYATWAAVGTATIAILGVLLFGESLSLQAVAGLALIILGVVLLNLAAGPGAAHGTNTPRPAAERTEDAKFL